MGACKSRQKKEVLYGMFMEEEKMIGESSLKNSKFPNDLLLEPKGLHSLQEVFQNSLKNFPNKACLGSRNFYLPNNPYQYKTYAQVNEIISQLGSGIKKMDLTTKTQFHEYNLELICVFCKNREEWLLLDIAAVHYNFQLVPLYDTLRVEDIKHILNETEMQTIFLSKQGLTQLLKLSDFCYLKNIILLDEKDWILDEEMKEKLKNINVLKFEDVIKVGQEILEFAKVKGEGPFTFCYTSGTTGLPKGVIQSHKSFLAFMPYTDQLNISKLNSSDIHLSYLPLPHIFERTIIWYFLYLGGTACFYGGDVQKITQDLKDAKPTVFISVPRLFNRIYSKMQEEIQKLSGIKKLLVNKAISTKIANLEQYGDYHHFLYDKLVFSKMKQIFGGNLKLMVSASAPIAPEIVKFLQIAISGPIIESYGLSETGSLCTTEPFDNCFGHVGGPMPCQIIKLIDVEEMNYLSTHVNSEGIPIPQGEICSKSPCNFLGYFKNDELTKQVIDSQGFFHTGDIGEILPNGVIRIIDRKKNIFKLQQGEYVAAEKVENIYTSIPGILQAFVYGDSMKAYLVGIIVPDQNYVKSIAQNKQIQGTFEELIQNDEINQIILNRLISEGKKANLYGFEQVKVIYLEAKLFESNNLLSTTFKLVRARAKEFYQQKINELYSKKIILN